MDPSIRPLNVSNRLLFTFTQRSLDPPLGVRAVFGFQTEDGFDLDFEHDLLVLDVKTPPEQTSGGGYGNTIMLDDGYLLTCYSYRDTTGAFKVESIRWQLPSDLVSSVETTSSTASTERLAPVNYPNPFNATTRLIYSVDKPGKTTITVFNLLGRQVLELTEFARHPGRQFVTLDLSGQPSGIYLFRVLSKGRAAQVGRLAYLK